ncbi:hypothetical protein STENM36S_07299 [Streptomyces tendae]
MLLAHLYAYGTDGRVCLGSGSDFAELLDALAHLGESERRLEELRTLLVRTATDSGAGLLALLGPSVEGALSRALDDAGRLDEGALDALRLVVADVNDRVGSLPLVRLQILLAPVIGRPPSPRRAGTGRSAPRSADGRGTGVHTRRPARVRDTRR